ARLLSVLACERVQGIVERDDSVRALGREVEILVEGYPISATLDRAPGAGMIDQNLAHDPRGHREEVATVAIAVIVISGQARMRRGDGTGWLQRVCAALTRKKASREPMRLGVDEDHQPIERSRVSCCHFGQKDRNRLGHRRTKYPAVYRGPIACL